MPLPATPPDTIALQTNRPDADLDGIRRLLHAATVAAISCVISSLPIHAQDAEPSGSIAASRDSILVIDSFDYPDAIGEPPPTWQGRSGWRQTLAEPEEIYYRIMAEDGNLFLRGETMGTAVNFGRAVDVNLRLHNHLRWRWRVHLLPEGGNERIAELNDSAAAVRLVFHGGIIPKTLKYVWSAILAPGTLLESPSNGRTKVIVLRHGSEHLGEWMWEEVNAYDDYKRAFGGEPRKVGAVAIITDSDNTNSPVRADYDDIMFLISGTDTTAGAQAESAIPDDTQEKDP